MGFWATLENWPNDPLQGPRYVTYTEATQISDLDGVNLLRGLGTDEVE
jgi:hypothetical protein